MPPDTLHALPTTPPVCCVLHLERPATQPTEPTAGTPFLLSSHWAFAGLRLPFQRLSDAAQPAWRDLAQALLQATSTAQVRDLLDDPASPLQDAAFPVFVHQPRALHTLLESALIPACPDLAPALAGLGQRLRAWPAHWPQPEHPPGWFSGIFAEWADAATPPERKNALRQNLLDAVATITCAAAQASERSL
ncbi:hypothetical protein [Amphibiibacter pelophylacis]|uniref:Uncharacterized protein n=1 Tax=Amphibiibacter pelophylacis TaxID=1799477 RepID=A0ACC6NZ70_9BURK